MKIENSTALELKQIASRLCDQVSPILGKDPMKNMAACRLASDLLKAALDRGALSSIMFLQMVSEFRRSQRDQPLGGIGTAIKFFPSGAPKSEGWQWHADGITMIAAAIDAEVRESLEQDSPASEWTTRKVIVNTRLFGGTMPVPQSTLQRWVQSDSPEIRQASDGGDMYLTAWVKARIERWRPGLRQPISKRKSKRKHNA